MTVGRPVGCFLSVSGSFCFDRQTDRQTDRRTLKDGETVSRENVLQHTHKGRSDQSMYSMCANGSLARNEQGIYMCTHTHSHTLSRSNGSPAAGSRPPVYELCQSRRLVLLPLINQLLSSLLRTRAHTSCRSASSTHHTKRRTHRALSCWDPSYQYSQPS